MRRLAPLVLIAAALAAGCAEIPVEPIDPDPFWQDATQAVLANYAPADVRERYRNIPDADGAGSCVQASLSYCGAHHAVGAAESLLRNSDYGPAVLGGSWPERVKQYCAQRKIDIFSVEGQPTLAAIRAACASGRYVAITYGQAHMICCVGVTRDAQNRETFWLWDNNHPEREPQPVDARVFEREHRATGGGWCVGLLGPAPTPWSPPQ